MYKIRQQLGRCVRVCKGWESEDRAKDRWKKSKDNEKEKKRREREKHSEKKGEEKFHYWSKKPSVASLSDSSFYSGRLRLPIKNTGFACLFVMQPRPAGTRYTMLQCIQCIQGDLRKRSNTLIDIISVRLKKFINMNTTVLRDCVGWFHVYFSVSVHFSTGPLLVSFLMRSCGLSRDKTATIIWPVKNYISRFMWSKHVVWTIIDDLQC